MTLKSLSCTACIAIIALGLPLAAQAKKHRHHTTVPATATAATPAGPTAAELEAARQACEDRKAARAKNDTEIGAVAGGLVGGLLEHGSTIKTVLGVGVGAGAGALAGHAIGKSTVHCPTTTSSAY